MHFAKSFVSLMFLAAAIILTGCQKNDPTSPAKNDPAPCLTKIIQNDGNFTEYSYEGERISKYVRYQSGSLRNSIRIKYNSEGLTENETVYYPWEEYRIQFLYNSQKEVVKAEIKLISDTNYLPMSYLLLAYDAKSRLNKFDQYHEQVSTPWHTTKFEYDLKGNIISEKRYYGEDLYKYTSYEYDDKNNPLNGYRNNGIFTAMFSSNNVTREVETEYIAGKEAIQETIYEYTYDAKGYPISRNIKKITDNLKNIVTETYIYK